MKVNETSTWRKTVQIFASFALVFSMIPICATHNSQVAEATDGGTTEEPWLYYSNVYPEDYQAKNTHKEIDVDAKEVGGKLIYDKDYKDSKDIYSQIVKHVIDATKDGNKIFKEGSATLDGTPSFTSNGAVEVQSNNDAVRIDTTTPVVTKSYVHNDDNPILITYCLPSEDTNNWELSFSVKGKDNDDKDLSVNVVATYNSADKTLNIKEKDEKFELPTESLEGDEVFNLEPIERIDEIKDVQTEDATTLKNFFKDTGIDTSFTGVELETDLPYKDLIYQDYKMVSVDDENWKVTFDEKDKKLKVTKKNAEASTSSLKLTFYAGEEFKEDGSNTLCVIDGADEGSIKTNINTKTAEAKIVSDAVSGSSLDLSFRGDTCVLKISGLSRNDYKITYDDKYKDLFDVSLDLKGKEPGITLKRKEAVSATAECLGGFEFNFYIGDDPVTNRLGDENFKIGVNQNTRTNDAKIVTDKLGNESKLFEVTYGQENPLVISFDGEDGMKRGDYLISGAENDYYSFEYNSEKKQLSIKPKKASDNQAKTVKLTFYVNSGEKAIENNQLVQVDLNVKVNKKEIKWNEDALPTGGKTAALDYRYVDDQISYVKDNIKDWINSDSVVGKDDVGLDLSKIGFSAYPTTDVETEKTFTVTGIKKQNSNYTFKNSEGKDTDETSLTLKVKKIASQEYTVLENFTFKGKQGDGTEVDLKDGIEKENEVWVNSDVTINWKDHKLADPVTESSNNQDLPKNTSENYIDTLSPSALNEDASEGSSIVASKIYAKDSKTNVVSKITDLKVNIDRTAPVVYNFGVNTGGVKEKSFVDNVISFFFPSNIRAKVSMNATDSNSGEQAVSGILKDSNAKVYYNDNGKDSWHDIAFDDTDKYPFHFEVDAADVDRITENFNVQLTDNAKNTNYDAAKDAKGLPEDVWELVQNNVAPSVSISFDNNDVRNGSFYNNNRKVTVQITADHFDLTKEHDSTQELVTFSINGNEQHVSIRDFGDDGKWERTFSDDADYTLRAQYVDLAGQFCSATADNWTIDKTTPEVSVIWDNENATNGNYYAAARTATVTITEHNFDASMFNVQPTGDGGNASEYGAPVTDDWSHFGDSHQCHVTFSGPGRYAMTIEGEDLAQNSLQGDKEVSEFVVDTTQPEITIAVNGEQDASSHAYPDNAGVSVAINDTNVDSSSQINVESISWNGNGTPYAENRGSSATSVTVDMPNPENKPESDGVYRITVNALDLAGNTQTKTVDWSVNRFGSTYVVSDSTKGVITKKYVKAKDMSDVAITEINPSGVNESSATAKIARGTNSQTLEKGQGFTFAEAADANGWPAFTYTISKDKYSSDAMYQTIVSSTDSAGRASDNTMADKSSDRKNSCDVYFAVDNTAPIVSFTGFDESIVAGREHKVNAYIEDNMKLDHAVIEVNGIEVESLDSSDLSDKNHEITLKESGDMQKLTVKAYDAAGNVCNVDSSQVFVNNDPLARLMHNTVLFVGLIVGGLVIIGGLVWYFFFYKRRKEEEQQA